MKHKYTLLLVAGCVALSGCMNVTRSPQALHDQGGNADYAAAQEILPALTLEKMRSSLPPLPEAPMLDPETMPLGDAASGESFEQVAQQIEALPEPPVPPTDRPQIALEPDENFIMSTSPIPDSDETINYMNAASAEAELPIEPPVLPEAPISE